MPTPIKPTCKVVKNWERPYGLRVFPKGCKIRGYRSGAGSGKIVRTDKKGNIKRKINVYRHKYFMISRLNNNNKEKFLYDTGATSIGVNSRVAEKWKLIKKKDDNTYEALFPYTATTARNADNVDRPIWLMKNIEMKVHLTDSMNRTFEEVIKGTCSVNVENPNSSLLFGVSGIAALKKKGIKFNIKSPNAMVNIN